MLGWGQLDEFSDADIQAIVRWIESDTLLRSREDLLEETIAELGFQRRGKKIVARISAAIDVVRGATGPTAPVVDAALRKASVAPLRWDDVEVVGESFDLDALLQIIRVRGYSDAVCGSM